MKLREFKHYCKGSYVEELIMPVINQLGGNWEDVQGTLHDVATCTSGAAGGFGGFVYYSDTSAFARKYRVRIVRSLERVAEEIGEDVIGMVKNFNCIKGDYTTSEIGKALWGRYDDVLMCVYNAMAWYALEEVANKFADFEYEQKNN